MSEVSKCDNCVFFNGGICAHNGIEKQQPVINCAAQVLTEDGWINAGFAIFENGEKIKVEAKN